jgi:hypothetical protein
MRRRETKDIHLLKALILLSVNIKIKCMKKPLQSTAKTGEICPESGVWRVVGSPSTTAPIAKGNRMPPYLGNAVTWKLIMYA